MRRNISECHQEYQDRIWEALINIHGKQQLLDAFAMCEKIQALGIDFEFMGDHNGNLKIQYVESEGTEHEFEVIPGELATMVTDLTEQLAL
jgi:hypothetical protein